MSWCGEDEMGEDNATRDEVAEFARLMAELLGPGVDDLPIQGFATLLALRASELCPGAEVGVTLFASDAGPSCAAGSTERARRLAAVRLEGEGSRSSDTVADTVAHSLPIQVGGEAVGVLEVFAGSGPVAADIGRLASLVQVTGAHLARRAALTEARTRVQQLEHALRDRVVVEQAIGMVAQACGVPMESAFESLRRHARNHNLRLAVLCESITLRETAVASIDVDFYPITAKRRVHLRDRALASWQGTTAETRQSIEGADRHMSMSVETRLEVQHARALRETDALGRAVDRAFREGARTARLSKRPRVLIREDAERAGSFVVGVLAGDTRFEVESTDDDTDTLSRSIVTQPDLVILGPDHPTERRVRGVGGDGEPDFADLLRRYCPDSRTLLVVDGSGAGDLAGRPRELKAEKYDAIFFSGDAPTLVALAAKLCGLRG